MTRALSSVLMTTLLASWPATTASADTPAKLTVGEESIEELLRLPKDLPSGRYTVHCEVIVGSQGSAKDSNCFALGKPVPRKLLGAVERAHQYAKFVPATRNGRRVDVFAQVMVLIDTTMSKPLVLAVPNNGAERRRYGLLYTGPQRFVERLAPDVHESVFNNFVFSSAPESVLVLWELMLDEQGKVLSFQLSDAPGVSPNTLFSIEASIKRMQFMPGYYNGQPQAMRYIEPMYSLR